MEAEATEVPRGEPVTPPASGGLDSFFKLTERGTTVGTEMKAGLATFMVMSYILFLNPIILSNMFAGDEAAAGAFIPAAAAATALIAGLLSILMGLVANYPIALAAGLGINGAVAFGLVLGQGLTPAGAMGVIVLEGLVVLLLVLVGLREAIMNAVPLGLKRAIGVGIGLFILFIGLVDAGVIINAPDASGPVPVQFVFPNTTALGVFYIGLLITIVLFVRKVPAALVLSIIATTIIALILGVQPFPETLTSPLDFSTIGDFDVTNVFSTLGLTAALLTIFSFMLTDFFDTMGTATAIVEQSGLTDDDGRVPGIGRVLLVDSVAAAAGGAAGDQLQHQLHRERGWRRRGRQNRPHRGRRGRALPVRHPPVAAGDARAVRRHRPGAGGGGLPDGDADQGHRLRRRRGRSSCTPDAHPDAPDVQHHHRDRRRVRQLGPDQAGARQVRRHPSADVGGRRCIRHLLRAGTASRRDQRVGPDRWRPAGPSGRALRLSPMDASRLRVDDFDYELPTDAIAQAPAEPRDSSRLLVLDRSRPAELRHATFRDVGEHLRAGDLLVVNDSRVIPARLPARRRSGGAVELLVLRPLDDGSGRWEALTRPSRKVRVGEVLELRNGEAVEVGEHLADGIRAVRFDGDPHAVMAAAGEMPLPPYIHDRSAPAERYQTVYAQPPGSAAAPTAGLHFTPELLATLADRGVGRASVTLHVGLDTFRPLEGEFIDEHRIHREWYEIPDAARGAMAAAREAGGRIVAVGTTAVRVLETAARTDAASGWTDLYITPPYAFRSVDALITNFHLPRSSLLLLVTAFVQAGMEGEVTPFEARDALLGAYREALDAGYRFFSFGDAMLIV